MILKKFVVVSGLPGVHKLLGNRGNGLIVEEFDSGKRRFVSSRKYQFTPLESIAIYTHDGDTVPLADVFQIMKDKLQEVPLPQPKMSSNEAFAYLRAILPNYDPDQVFHSDVKKLTKWFAFLNDRDLLDHTEEDEEDDLDLEENEDIMDDNI